MSAGKLKVLSSFIKGFGRENASDVINALFIAKELMNAEVSLDFENRDNNGVDSPEIRRLLFFNKDYLLEHAETQNIFFKAGRVLSKLNSKELRWTAQFLLNKKKHLYEHEVKKAEETITKLKESFRTLHT